MNDQIKILNNKIDCFPSYDALYRFVLDQRGKQLLTNYITVNNVHTMIEAFWDKKFQEVINNSFLSIPDGKPLQVVGRLQGNKNISRLFGPTVMETFIDWGRKDNVSHFFFGSSEKNLAKLKSSIDRQYPGTKIVGMYSPPYKAVEEWDNVHFIEMINKTKPDFIWVGLGAPKQEKWMFQHHKKISSGVMFGIGAGFDYLAGNIKHAPNWMKQSSLEWLFRLIQEPKRLWKRYLSTIPQFIILSSLELVGIRFK